VEAYRELLAELTQQVGESGTPTMRKKRARQAARSVLHNCAETKIVVTGNARAWRHFCEMRGSPTAEIEIRKLAVSVLQALQAEAPHIFDDMTLVPHEDGVPIIQTAHSKV
jgi:thymidylate synthase (FAD)